jgi:hypothetical protein
MHMVRLPKQFVALLLVMVGLTACSAGAAPLVAPSPAGPTGEALVSSTPISTATLAAPGATVTPTENDPDQQVIRSYHTLLMLERADDLIITVIQKMQAGEIPVGDPSLLHPYTDAFPMAVDEFNQTAAPSGFLNNGWNNVSKATIQYNMVYAVLIQGKGISTKDWVTLRMIRQLLTNYQSYAEGYLKQKGRGEEFFASEHKAAEDHFQKNYGDQPFPTLTAPPLPQPSVTPKP